MIQEQAYILILLYMLLDGLCLILAGYGGYFFKKYAMSQGMWSMEVEVFVFSVFLIMVVTNYAMANFGLYSDQRFSSYLSLLFSILKSILVAFSVLAACIFIFQLKQYSRAFLFFFAGLSFLFIAAYRLLFQLYLDVFAVSRFGVRKILIIGEEDRANFVSKIMESQLSWGHEIIGRLTIEKQDVGQENVLGTIDELDIVLRNKTVDEVVFAIERQTEINFLSALDTCRRMGVSIRILPTLWKSEDGTLSMDVCQGIPFITIRSGRFNATGLIWKRILDIVGSFIGTSVFILIYPFIAVAIKFDSKGPVLFLQKRVGKNGRVFNLLKFRSMVHDAEKFRNDLMPGNVMNGAMFKIKDDPRITKVGRWLRRTSLDELPQFLNVLKGEMSLVGTRPPMVEEVKDYHIEHLKRLSSKPGITGLWQVSGRNKITDFDEVVKLDCKYLDNWRFFDDILILVKTIFVVFRRKGAF